MVVYLTEDNFKNEVLESPVPVLVDFWAEWCAPCSRMTPILEALAQELAGKIKIAQLEVDECSDIADTYSIMSIPTLAVFNRGVVVSSVIGVQSKDALLKLLDL